MRNSPWFSLVVAVCVASSGCATALGGPAGRLARPDSGGRGGSGLQVSAAEGPGELSGSRCLPPLKRPIIQARPKRFARVLSGPVLPLSDRALHGRRLSRDGKTVRWAGLVRGSSAAERCVLFCRFLF